MTEVASVLFRRDDIRRRIEHAHSREDKRVLNKQLDELKQQINVLRSRLP
jgi:hypothetical protein